MADDKPNDDAAAVKGWTAEDTAILARSGDTEAARDILREFVEAIDLSSERGWAAPLPWHYARYIAEAFRKIVNDGKTDAGLALGVRTVSAGRPPGTATHSKVNLAAGYWLLVRRGQGAEQANELIGQATGADRRTIQRAAEACSNFQDPKMFNNDDLIAIIAQFPALSAILDAV